MSLFKKCKHEWKINEQWVTRSCGTSNYKVFDDFSYAIELLGNYDEFYRQTEYMCEKCLKRKVIKHK